MTDTPPPIKKKKRRKYRTKGRRKKYKAELERSKPYSTRKYVSRCNTIDAVHFCACEVTTGWTMTKLALALQELGHRTNRKAIFNWRRYGVPLHMVNDVAKIMGVPRGLLSPSHFGNCDCWKYGNLLDMAGLARRD